MKITIEIEIEGIEGGPVSVTARQVEAAESSASAESEPAADGGSAPAEMSSEELSPNPQPDTWVIWEEGGAAPELETAKANGEAAALAMEDAGASPAPAAEEE